MSEISRDPIRVKVFPKGQVVIPIGLRRKYDISIGDQIDVIPKENGILLKPGPKGAVRESLTKHLFGIFRRYTAAKPEADKNDIRAAVEKGFTERYGE